MSDQAHRAIVPIEVIERRIYLIRGHKVMVDRDLAALYQVKPIGRRGLRQQLLQLSRSHSHSVSPARTRQVAKDPDDNKFLECADAEGADYLITGNHRHLPKFWKKTKVITPREFVASSRRTSSCRLF